MRNFMLSLILLAVISGIGWEWVGIIPLDFMDNNKETEIRQFIIEKWIDNIKIIHPHCRGAYIRFVETDDANIIDVYAKCNKWGV